MKTTGNSADLRKRAESYLNNSGDHPCSGREIKELLHELSVHQIELELQNQELTAAQAEAESAHQKYFALYDLAPVGYAGIAIDGTIRDINLTGADLLGLERKHIIGKRLGVFVKNGDVPELNEFLRKAFFSGVKESCEITTRPEGHHSDERTIMIEGRVQRDENGIPLCRLAIVDVTARRLAERQLAQADQVFEEIIDSAAGPIVVWDSHFRIVRFNRAFSRLTGRDAKKTRGQPLALIFPEEFREQANAIVRRTGKGEHLEGVEIPILGRGGEIRTVLWNSATIPTGGDPATVYSVGQGQDITDRKKAEEEIRQRNEELNAANRELEEIDRELRVKEAGLSASLAEKEILLSEIHHRVKNNLAAFISLLSLEGSYDDTLAGSMLKKDLQNRARTMALIHETLYRTRKFAEVDMDTYLTTLVGQVAASYEMVPAIRTRVSAKGITLDIGRATPCGLIVNELLTNAFKYAFPPGWAGETGRTPEIVVSLARDGDEYELVVRDNGAGIPKAFRTERPKTLGLRLVTFLARHQLRATTTFRYDGGTEVAMRFRVDGQGAEPQGGAG